MTTRVCPNCGKEFEPSRANQRYCSIPCRERGYYKRYKKYHDRLNAKRKDALHASWGWNTCAECGRVYAVTAANLKIVCSEECRKKRIARQIKEAHRRQTAKAWELAHPNEGTYEEHLKAKAAEKAANKAIKDIEQGGTETLRGQAQALRCAGHHLWRGTGQRHHREIREDRPRRGETMTEQDRTIQGLRQVIQYLLGHIEELEQRLQAEAEANQRIRAEADRMIKEAEGWRG